MALCASMIELPRRMRAIAGSTDLQREILAWQDAAMREFFQRRPMAQLEAAIAMKAGSPATARQRGLKACPTNFFRAAE